MHDMMEFPGTWEEFLRQYEFEDSDKVYTNGAMLIPSFRVVQMIERYFPLPLGQKVYTIVCPCGGCYQERIGCDIYPCWEAKIEETELIPEIVPEFGRFVFLRREDAERRLKQIQEDIRKGYGGQ